MSVCAVSNFSNYRGSIPGDRRHVDQVLLLLAAIGTQHPIGS